MRIESDLAEVDGGAASFGHHLDLLFLLGLGVDSVHTNAHLEAAEVKDPAPEPNCGPDSEVAFAQCDESGEQHNGVRSEMVRLHAVEDEEIMKELAHWEPESALEVCEEDNAFAIPGRGHDLVVGN